MVSATTIIGKAAEKAAEYGCLESQTTRSAEEQRYFEDLAKIAREIFDNLPVQIQRAIAPSSPPIGYYAHHLADIVLHQELDTWVKGVADGRAAAQRILEFVGDPERTALDLSSLLERDEEFPPGFEHPAFARLKRLELADNELEWLPFLAQCKNLEYVNARMNNLEDIKLRLPSSLLTLDLRNNDQLWRIRGEVPAGCQLLLEGTPDAQIPYNEDSIWLLLERLSNFTKLVEPASPFSLPTSFNDGEKETWFDWADKIYQECQYETDAGDEEVYFLREVAHAIFSLTKAAGQDSGLKAVFLSRIHHVIASEELALPSILELAIDFQIDKEQRAEKPQLENMARLLINGCWTMSILRKVATATLENSSIEYANLISVHLTLLTKLREVLDIPLTEAKMAFATALTLEDIEQENLDRAEQAVLIERGNLEKKVRDLMENTAWINALVKRTGTSTEEQTTRIVRTVFYGDE